MFSDWLVDRRHCTLKWQNAVMTIREKINAALQDMPENEEIKQLLMGTCQSLLGLIYSNLGTMCGYLLYFFLCVECMIRYRTKWVGMLKRQKTTTDYEKYDIHRISIYSYFDVALFI